jgi:septin family protein
MLTRLFTATGIANLPNQRHKIVAKRGAAFTIMVREKGIQTRGTPS